MRVGLIGYGAVAAVHAAQLGRMPDVELTVVCGPSIDKARAFASDHDVDRTAVDLSEAAGWMDAAIVCSPSQEHFSQALQLLQSNVRVLVELPACGTQAEAHELQQAGAAVACAHTSRYLEPYQAIREWIVRGELGAINQVHYIRHIPPRHRSWTDDALIHHAAHVMDLMLHWFGSVEPEACLCQPAVVGAQDLSMAAVAGAGTHLTVNISYTSRLPQLAMTVAGSRHTVITDGFSFLRSDDPARARLFDGDGQYHQAVYAQDRAFLDGDPVPWSETIALFRLTDLLRRMGERS